MANTEETGYDDRYQTNDNQTTCTDKDNVVCKAEEAYNRFNIFASRLAVQSERRKAIERIEKELAKIAEVLANWPMLTDSLEKAKALQDISKRCIY